MKITKSLGLVTILLGGLVIINACSSKSGNTKLEYMAKKDISKMIVKGKTTESGVRSMFGEPQETDFMTDGRKKWKYIFMHKEEKGINYVPVANWFVGGTNDTAKTLLVLFKNGTVDDYMFSTSVGETMTGAI